MPAASTRHIEPLLPAAVQTPSTISVGQTTGVSIRRALVRGLPAAPQPQGTTAAVQVRAVMTVTQAQASVISSTGGHPGLISVTQGQSISVKRAIAMTMAAGSHSASALAQPGHLIQASMSTNATVDRAIIARAVAVQARSLTVGVAKNVRIAGIQARAAIVSRQPARTAAAGQGQSAGVQATTSRFAVVLVVAQDQAIVLRRALVRHISTSQAQSVSLGGARFLRPGGIASTVRFGRPTVTRTGKVISPVGIASTARVGTPTLSQPVSQYIFPKGWVETEQVGTPTVSHTSPVISPSGIPPSSVVGIPIILQSTPGAGVPGGGLLPRNVLIDRLTREVYPWPLNHATEDAVKTLGRRLTRSGISASGKLIQSRKVFLIRHPTHPGPMHLVLHGALIDHDRSQYQAFIRFFDECDDRTFDYIDASGDSYHISIVQFDARRRNAPSRVDGSYFTYSLEVEVIEVNQGAYAGYVV